jgi:tetratricopeptide (TPR) repeat protein
MLRLGNALAAAEPVVAQWIRRLWAGFLHSWHKYGGVFIVVRLLLVPAVACGYFVALTTALALFAFVWALRRLISCIIWWWRRLFVKPIDAVVTLLVLCAFGAVGSAVVLRLSRPETTVIISPFELSSTPPQAIQITGKTAANLLKDEVATILSKARLYSAPATQINEPYNDKGRLRARSVALGQGPEISAVAIEVEGLSFEKIFALYDEIRQDQRHVEGDVIFVGQSDRPRAELHLVNMRNVDNSCKVGLQARMPKIGSWKTSSFACDEAGLRQAVNELAEMIFRDFSPNTLALYLQNLGRTKEAIQILRQLVAEDPTKVQSILDLGVALDGSSDYWGAILEYRKSLQLKPKYPEQVHSNLGLALYNVGATDEAETEYREAIRLNKRSTKAHNNLGTLLMRKGERKPAVDEFLKALAVDKDDGDAHDNYGLWLDTEGQIEKAIDEFREAVRLQPAKADFHLDLGAEFEKKEDYGGAITEFREFVRLKPNEPWAHTDLGNALTENGEFEEAVREHQLALTLQPNFPEAHQNLAFTYRTEGKFEAAVDEDSWAIRLRPEFTLARCDLARDLNLAGEYEASLVNFKEAIEKSPEDNVALAETRAADALRDARDFDAAIEHYTKALKKKDDYDAYIGLGYTYHEQYKLADAMKSFQHARSLRDDAYTHVGIGIVLESEGWRAAAIVEYRQALQRDPDNPFAHKILADALEAQGEYVAARRERDNAWAGYRLAIRRRPNEVDVRQDLANVLNDLGYHEAAITNLDAALRADPENAELHNSRGFAKESWGEQATAIEEYRRAVQIKPNFTLGHINLGQALNLEGQHEQAISAYQQALQVAQSDPWVHTDLGLTYDDEGKYEDAIAQHLIAIQISEAFPLAPKSKESFSEGHSNLCLALSHKGAYAQAIEECHKALRATPHSQEAHLNLGEALQNWKEHCSFCFKAWIGWNERKEYEAAVTESETALKLRQDAETYFISGRAYYGLGADSQAIKQFRNALLWKEIYPKTHYYLGLALRRSGQTDQAADEFKEAHRLDPYLSPP